ncbi:hypothetical protein DFP74_2855 [Nocardiopsis sp. Huas11]|uniref:hypothetical protein n=1 Tax=Nocardiopsis sp. Huas11 TaxID=2183912 RepID=UPI000EB575D1|nr:hypothetical protein [Nocardiopsis sp. Huas11]RKS07198.1 hypothetical protein DFP74_2855 [Nocardiopsis sp. Huas11]
MTVTLAPFTVNLVDHRFDPRWNRIPGLEVKGASLSIEPDDYFFRLESTGWRVIDWDTVTTEMLPVEESSDLALEQKALTFISDHVRTTHDPAEVLAIAWNVYSYLFREEHLPTLDVPGITAEHLRILAEVSTLTALNKVDQDGRISIVGPAWFFGDTARVVYDLDEPTVQALDEVFHGGLFNENRRIESVKAHTALGGRLVHGCQSTPSQKGGVVAAYGTPMDRFRDELAQFRDAWITAVRSF